MLILDEISFQNQKFKSREIYLPEFGVVTISTIALNRLLLNDDDGYISEEATFIDEQIFFFVDDEEIAFPEKKLRSLIISAVC